MVGGGEGRVGHEDPVDPRAVPGREVGQRHRAGAHLIAAAAGVQVDELDRVFDGYREATRGVPIGGPRVQAVARQRGRHHLIGRRERDRFAGAHVDVEVREPAADWLPPRALILPAGLGGDGHHARVVDGGAELAVRHLKQVVLGNDELGAAGCGEIERARLPPRLIDDFAAGVDLHAAGRGLARLAHEAAGVGIDRVRLGPIDRPGDEGAVEVDHTGGGAGRMPHGGPLHAAAPGRMSIARPARADHLPTAHPRYSSGAAPWLGGAGLAEVLVDDMDGVG